MRKKLALVFAITLLPCVSLAQEKPKDLPEIITFEGHGFAFKDNWQNKDKTKHGSLVVYDVVSAWDGHILKGNCVKFEVALKGAKWCFASAENKTRFEKKTEDGENDFLPFAGGRCALGMSWGTLMARGNPLSARVIVDDMGDAHLVMHGNVKWWWRFNDDRFGQARRLLLAVSGPRIVPNEQLEKDAKKTN